MDKMVRATAQWDGVSSPGQSSQKGKGERIESLKV